MSDESDFDDETLDSPNPSIPGASTNSDDPKRHARAQHNALERRRRDNIKDMYTSLKDTVPEMQNERASRAVILRRAIDSIDEKTAKHNQIQAECEHFRKENAQLEEEIRLLREQGGSEHVQTTVTRTLFGPNS